MARDGGFSVEPGALMPFHQAVPEEPLSSPHSTSFKAFDHVSGF